MNGAEVSILIKAHDQASAVLSGLKGKLEGFGQSAQRAGLGLTAGLTVPIVAMGAAAVNQFTSFDAAMTQSTSIMGDLTDTMRNDLAAAAREVGKTTTFSAQEAAESYFFLASAGLDAAASMEALPVVAQFAQAGMFDMALATDLLTDAQSALGLTIRDDAVANMANMIRISDVLVKGNVLANASVQQFAEALTNKAGPALRLVNKDVEEGVAVLAAMADQGVKGAEAGERLNIILRDLQSASIRNREEFNALGISVFDAQGNMRNIADVVGDLEVALAGMSDEQVRTTLMTLGFQDRSVSALLTLLGMSDAIREYEQELRSAGGATEEIARKQLESAKAQWQLFKGRLADTAITLGAVLVPALLSLMDNIDPLIGAIERAVNWFSALDPTMQTAAFAALGLLAALGPLLMIVGSMALGISALIPIFTLLLGPVGLVILALVALGIGIALVIRHWDEIKAKLEAIGFMDGLRVILDAIRVALKLIIPPIQQVIGFFRTNETAGKALLLALAALIVVMFTLPVAIIAIIAAIGLLSKHWDDIKAKTLEVWTSIRDFLVENFGFLRGVFEFAFRYYAAIVVFAFNTIGNYIQTAMEVVRGVIKVVTSLISGDWSGAWEGIKQIFTALWDGLITDIKLKLAFFRDIFIIVLALIVNYFGELGGKLKAAIGSASMILYDVGRDIMNGLWNGLKDKWEDVKRWVSGLGSSIKNLKGPIEVDRQLLIPEGVAIMQGLERGLRRGFEADVQPELHHITRSIGGDDRRPAEPREIAGNRQYVFIDNYYATGDREAGLEALGAAI